MKPTSLVLEHLTEIRDAYVDARRLFGKEAALRTAISLTLDKAQAKGVVDFLNGNDPSLEPTEDGQRFGDELIKELERFWAEETGSGEWAERNDNGPVRRSRRRRVLTVAAGLAIVLSMVVYLPNRSLHVALATALTSDPRNDGIDVSVHYGNYVDRSTLVFDLRNITGDKAPIDVFRALLQFADEVQDRAFNEVRLAWRGQWKFTIPGEYFQELGREYGFQNPVYTARTFPQHLRTPTGTSAYGTWTGGLLGVTLEQLEDFNDFHRKWYLNDLALV